MDTINKLLKKQAPKRRGKIAAAETAGDTTPRIQEPQEPEKPDATLIRWVSNRESCKVGVPSEWLGTPADTIFENGGSSGGAGRKLVEV
jgi:Ino eighty subunit 2